jgi:hypothetical protein
MLNVTPAARVSRATRPTNVSAAVVNSYSQVYTGRQGRHQAREWRRRGNWNILAIPPAVLWLEDACAASVLDADEAVECAAAMTDLWP